MTVSLPLIPARTARRLLMQGAGLLSPPNSPADQTTTTSTQEIINSLGFVQIDTINTLVRAHHHILHTRLDRYRPEHLKPLLESERSCFEHWTHDASIIPTRFLQPWRFRFARYSRLGLKNPWWKKRMGNPRKIIREVMTRIEREGPLMSRDFEHPRPRKQTTTQTKISGSGDNSGDDSGGGWWGWKPHKAALEYLWRCGRLTVTRRINFQKCYDLTDRCFPDLDRIPLPTAAEHIDWACHFALDRLTVATPAEISGFLNAISLAEVRTWCKRAVAQKTLIPVRIASAVKEEPRPAFALPDWEVQSRGLPDPSRRIRLLSPFDPLIRDRKRLFRLFSFEYRFEAFVPQKKRKYGYYVLPLLERDQLVGRLDARHNRSQNRLEILNLWWEPQHKPPRTRKNALKASLRRLARLIGAESIKY